MATQETRYWTNPSVLQFAGDADPFNLITEKAKEVVLKAIQDGWQGPPFDPFKLASLLQISTIPREDVLDARILPTGSQRLQIEFNPNRPRGRTRFSVAHEIAHTLFPDCVESTRNRSKKVESREDDWQLELLCNVAASEFLMPAGGEIDSKTPVNIDNLLRLQKQFDVSTEAISIRLAKLTLEPCTMITAARIADSERMVAYRIDYSIPSRTSVIEVPRGLVIRDKVISQCTAVGYTAKGRENYKQVLRALSRVRRNSPISRKKLSSGYWDSPPRGCRSNGSIESGIVARGRFRPERNWAQDNCSNS